MRWNVNGTEYTSNEELDNKIVAVIYNELFEQHQKLDKKIKFGLKAVARVILTSMEVKHKTQVFRPPEGVDPALHLLDLIIPLMLRGLEDGKIELTTDTERSAITSLNVSIAGDGHGRRHMAHFGQAGNGQDDLRQTLDLQPGSTVSNE